MKRLLSLFLLLALAASTATASIIPPEGVHAGFFSFTGIAGKRAVVLCESLTVCDAPNGNPIDSFSYGESLVATQSRDGWVYGYYSDGNQTGWVRSDYLLIDPAYYVADAETPVHAYPDVSAPRVALLSAGTRLPIVRVDGDWLIVSLRGAAGCVRKTSADMGQFAAAPLLPDEHEIPQTQAHELAKAHLVQNNLASAQTLSAWQHGFAYYGGAQVGWVVLWRDDSGRIVWQVSLEKHTGAVLEAIKASDGLG
ncbi:MAG: hypothetical protein IJ313_11280 [Clostridia bacterium]|nr:hypothetical protein [Clostridia bacterium]